MLLRHLPVAAAAALALLATPASAAPPAPGDYRADDFAGGSAYNIIPPGQNGFTSASSAADFLASGDRPMNQNDQTDPYANLVYRSPGLRQRDILDFFKDNSFGVRPGEEQASTNPVCAVVVPPSPASEQCDDVTITRDGFGVPHIYGANRAALMFGIGYTTGRDRLFLADVLRNGGRGQLSSFAGGSRGNRSQDQSTFASAPYMNEAEYQIQFDQADDIYGQAGVQIQLDVQNYVDGMNQWIAETRAEPVNKLDALYAATNHPEGPAPWKVTDVIATGALVAGIFGKGGGGEMGSALALQDAQRVLGRKRGKRVWADFRNPDDREADRTVKKKVFPYRVPGGRRGLAMPDPGSVEAVPVVKPGSNSGSAASRSTTSGATGAYADFGALLKPLSELEGGSNALLVSGRESANGRPIAVFGPQTGYFAPQLLMEQDGHAPATAEFGPAIDARGVSFVGTNLYVQLGRGVDYAWSATSAGQDIIDTYAVKLCEPDGGEPTVDSMHYVWDGECLPIEVIERTNEWVPNAADQTPPGSQTLQAFRTNAGLISHRGTVKGVPHAFTKLRATYKREVDAAASFADWNSPDVVKGARSWIRAGYKDDLTFNWFYIDSRKIAYFNSGANPQRPDGTPATFPVKAQRRFMWKDYDPVLNTFRREPISAHAQVVDQRFMTSWNNKPAKGYNCDDQVCYTSVYRVRPLTERIQAGIRGKRKMTLVKLIDAMEDAGTVDLRGATVVPLAIQAMTHKKLGRPRGEVAKAIGTLRRWVRDGAHRRDFNNDGNYDNDVAVKLIDAWWPLWTKGQFEPILGDELVDRFTGGHNAPGSTGSAFQSDSYGQVSKDLRKALGRKVKSPYSRVYCGKGRIKACGKMLRRTLTEASSESFEDLYGTGGCTLNNGTSASAQMCHDAVNSTDVTVAAVGPFHWINRPTFQQAIQFQSHR